MIELDKLMNILEGVLLSSAAPMSIEQLRKVFAEEEQPSKEEVRDALIKLAETCHNRAFELSEVASGFRFQVKAEYSKWVGNLWHERPTKYSRATLETLALIAYKQPITRGEVEEVRGVAVSTQIIKTLMERGWVQVVGHKEVPGRPALYATTQHFLDDLNLQSLEQLPPLSEIQDIENIEKHAMVQLQMEVEASNDDGMTNQEESESNLQMLASEENQEVLDADAQCDEQEIVASEEKVEFDTTEEAEEDNQTEQQIDDSENIDHQTESQQIEEACV